MEQLIFYKSVESLNSETHKHLKISPSQDFRFAAQTNSVPLSGVEFAEAGKEYPIAFAKGEEGQAPVPVAVLGLENHENLLVSPTGIWEGRYIPAFVRRYPFVLAGGPQDQQLTVCVDRECPRLGEQEGEPLFVNGEPSAFMRQTLDFLQDFQRQVQLTAQFAQRLVDFGLLVERQVDAVAATGERYSLAGLWVVDEAALRALNQERVYELFQSGELALIYLHLISLSNLNRILERKKPAPPTVAH
jgi:hypothetical protein